MKFDEDTILSIVYGFGCFIVIALIIVGTYSWFKKTQYCMSKTGQLDCTIVIQESK